MANSLSFTASGTHWWVGLLLIAVAWPLNWLWPGLRTHVLFFPLWLGYILTVDALVVRRSGTSLLSRSPRDFASLFVLSVPAWWLFELINRRTGNWHYSARESFSDLEYFLLASLCFSTVIPAVFSTAELMRTFRWVERFARGPQIIVTPRLCRNFFLIGCIMFALLLALPRYFYPFVWLSLFFIIEPINLRLGKRSLLTGVQQGDWRTVVALCVGTLMCGFFWEMWNYYADPKWFYRIPFFGFWHIFEMPLFGYFGYLPFALELYAITQLATPRALSLRF